MNQSPIHAQLRRDTAGVHAQVEQQLDLLGPELSLRRYRRTLQTLYGFYVPLELRLMRFAPAVLPDDVPLRARADLLVRDLCALGMPRHALAGLPQCPELPRLARPEHVAGCMYVIEGASLGGRVIARALQERLGLHAENGAAFFVGDADATGPRWKRLLGWLDRLARSGARCDSIAAAACDTFGALSRWVLAQGALR